MMGRPTTIGRVDVREINNTIMCARLRVLYARIR